MPAEMHLQNTAVLNAFIAVAGLLWSYEVHALL